MLRNMKSSHAVMCLLRKENKVTEWMKVLCNKHKLWMILLEIVYFTLIDQFSLQISIKIVKSSYLSSFPIALFRTINGGKAGNKYVFIIY